MDNSNRGGGDSVDEYQYQGASINSSRVQLDIFRDGCCEALLVKRGWLECFEFLSGCLHPRKIQRSEWFLNCSGSRANC